MLVINYPKPEFLIKQEGGKEIIFDPLRKRWLMLTPEEWVRQNFIQYLVQTLHYPAAFIAIEKEIMLGELKKRFDILVYDKDHKPWMMIECKAAAVDLNEAALHQVLRYHISVPVSFLIITNGHTTYGWKKIEPNLKVIQQMPLWR